MCLITNSRSPLELIWSGLRSIVSSRSFWAVGLVGPILSLSLSCTFSRSVTSLTGWKGADERPTRKGWTERDGPRDGWTVGWMRVAHDHGGWMTGHGCRRGWGPKSNFVGKRLRLYFYHLMTRPGLALSLSLFPPQWPAMMLFGGRGSNKGGKSDFGQWGGPAHPHPPITWDAGPPRNGTSPSVHFGASFGWMWAGMDLSCIYIYILWMRTPSSIDYVAFCFYNAIDNEAHRALGCSLYNPIVDKFPSLFQNVILGSLESIFSIWSSSQRSSLSYEGHRTSKHIVCWNAPCIISSHISFHHSLRMHILENLESFFQLDRWVDVSLCLTKDITLCHLRESAGLIPPYYCTFSPISLLASWTLESILFHCQAPGGGIPLHLAIDAGVHSHVITSLRECNTLIHLPIFD